MATNQEIPKIRSYTTKELTLLYEVDRHTLQKWFEPFLEEIGERRGWYYTPKQVETIFKLVGIPKNTELEQSKNKNN